MLFLLASTINTVFIDYSSQWVSFNNLLSFAILGLCSILPIVLVILACRKYDQLKDSESAETKKWGVSMEGIKMPRVLPLD
jgi:hypothetical protein